MVWTLFQIGKLELHFPSIQYFTHFSTFKSCEILRMLLELFSSEMCAEVIPPTISKSTNKKLCAPPLYGNK